jgi:predicted enzyme related to lactoylglutathione lyase
VKEKAVRTKIKHMAILSPATLHLSVFYETVFGMHADNAGRTAHVTDGYVGMNINPMANGRKAGLNHYGFEVDDVKEVEARLHEAYPAIELARRPSNRPFAGLTTHDPEGNIFDLSFAEYENRGSVYVREEQRNARYISHFMVPAVNAPALVKFYKDIFDFQELPKRGPDDPNSYLTDGMVTMIIHQWTLSSYGVGGLDGKPSIDHMGFHVESLEAFLADVDRLAENDPSLAPKEFRVGTDELRQELFKRTAIGKYQMADPEWVMLDITDE